MKYNFDIVNNRVGTASEKWDVAPGELPMWVADMDFQCAPEITEAIKARVDHGIFGYSFVPDEWADAYVNWWSTRHGFTMERDWLIFSTGVMAKCGRIYGHYMVSMNFSNKKLVDLATRRIADLCGVSYEKANYELFLSRLTCGDASPVRATIERLKTQAET